MKSDENLIIKGNNYLLINKSLGSLFDQGKRSLIFFIFILLIIYVRYSSLLSPLALAVCTIENNLPVVVAPSAVLQNKNDFLAITLSKILDNVIYPRLNIIREDFQYSA